MRCMCFSTGRAVNTKDLMDCKEIHFGKLRQNGFARHFEMKKWVRKISISLSLDDPAKNG